MTIAVTQNNFETEVLQSDKLVLVDFWAAWCGPCKMLGPVLEEFSNEHPEYKICKIDVDVEKELAAQYSIASIPTMLVFNKGEKVARHTGFMAKGMIEDIMNEHK